MQPDPPDLPPEPFTYDLAAAAFDGVELDGETLAGERRAGLRFVDCRLRGCDLANLYAPSVGLRRVHVRSGRLTGALLTDGEFENVLFEDCRADLAAFGATTLNRVRFASCVLTQADFQQTRMQAVVFDDCDLTDADLSGARFAQVELRGCRLTGVRGVEQLKGVRMPWADILENAGVFAGACGVQTLDTEEREPPPDHWRAAG